MVESMSVWEWLDQNYWFVTAMIQSGCLIVAWITGFVMGGRDAQRVLERKEMEHLRDIVPSPSRPNPKQRRAR